MGKLALIALLLLSACNFYNGPQIMAAPAQPVGSTKEVQGTLQQQGLYHGKLDGIPGPLTMDAVRSYQKAHQLPATGRLNTETMNNLNLH